MAGVDALAGRHPGLSLRHTSRNPRPPPAPLSPGARTRTHAHTRAHTRTHAHTPRAAQENRETVSVQGCKIAFSAERFVRDCHELRQIMKTDPRPSDLTVSCSENGINKRKTRTEWIH
ncbi:uncharacterized protein LOC144293781 [Canis aureus]